DDLADVASGAGVAQPDPDEIRNRDRHRLHVALGNVELEHRRCRLRRKPRERGHGGASAQGDQSAAAPGAWHPTALNHGPAFSREGWTWLAADHVAGVESYLDVFPLLVVFGFEHVVRLTAEQRAHRAVASGDEQRALSAGKHHRRSGKGAVGLELDA